jgi:L-ribulose-5-phosphate 3-epimerase UlaE
MKEVWPEFLKYYEVPAGEVTVDMTENLEKLPWENINVPIGIEDLPKAMKEAAKKVKKEKHKF